MTVPAHTLNSPNHHRNSRNHNTHGEAPGIHSLGSELVQAADRAMHTSNSNNNQTGRVTLITGDLMAKNITLLEEEVRETTS
jgi:hypothetical protein